MNLTGIHMDNDRRADAGDPEHNHATLTGDLAIANDGQDEVDSPLAAPRGSRTHRRQP